MKKLLKWLFGLVVLVLVLGGAFFASFCALLGGRRRDLDL